MPMYRRHFSGATVHRNIECPIQVLPNVPWRDCLSEEVLHFMPKVFDGVHVWTLCEVHSQFVNNTQISHATEDNVKSAQKHATWPPALSLSWSSHHTILLSCYCQTACGLELFSIIWVHARCARCKLWFQVTHCCDSIPRWAGGDIMNNKAGRGPGHVCSKFEHIGHQTRTERIWWFACFWAVLYYQSWQDMQFCKATLFIRFLGRMPICLDFQCQYSYNCVEREEAEVELQCASFVTEWSFWLWTASLVTESPDQLPQVLPTMNIIHTNLAFSLCLGQKSTVYWPPFERRKCLSAKKIFNKQDNNMTFHLGQTNCYHKRKPTWLQQS